MLTSAYCIIWIICILTVFLSLFPSLLSINFTAGRYFFFPSLPPTVWFRFPLLYWGSTLADAQGQRTLIRLLRSTILIFNRGACIWRKRVWKIQCDQKRKGRETLNAPKKHSKFHQGRNISALGSSFHASSVLTSEWILNKKVLQPTCSTLSPSFCLSFSNVLSTQASCCSWFESHYVLCTRLGGK